MLVWASKTNNVSSSTRNFTSNIISKIGNLESISFERDGSKRVARVVLNGDKGSAKMAGWLFKAIWNVWVGNVQPSGETDYIYSLTFFLNKK
jgi:hypothetical protein